MSFPNIHPPASINPKVFKPAFRMPSESGYTVTFKKITKTARSFILSWPLMSDSDRVLLEAAFEADSGGSFLWTNPQTLVQHTVTYGDDELSFEYVGPDAWQIKVRLDVV